MKRIVLKVGSAVLTQDNKLATTRLSNLVDLIAKLKEKYEVILVSSGAVAAGYTLLPLDKSIVGNKQALASIGQPLLMKEYKERFHAYDIICAQVLLTADDFDSRKRTHHAITAMEVISKNKVLPIINENDVTATVELGIGDNDQLAAYATKYFEADMLVILTDIDGYYDKNPHEFDDAVLQKNVHSIDPEHLKMEHTPNSQFATGGIVTKLKAAQFILENDNQMYLSSGFDLHNAYEFLLNDNHIGGTLFKRQK